MKDFNEYKNIVDKLRKQKEINLSLLHENKLLHEENNKLKNISESTVPYDELQDEEYLLDILMKNIPSRIYFKNTKGQFIKINKRLALRHGYNNIEEMLGKSDFDYFTKEDAESTYENEKKIMSTMKPLVDIERREFWANGKITWASTSKFPLLSKKGDVIGIFGITKDITKRKKIEKALRESEAKLKESNITKDKFFSIIAHDLKNPFTSILGFAELLMTSYDKYDKTQHKEFIQFIYQGIQKTYSLLEELLLWSRAQKGTIEFKKEEINIYELAKNNIELTTQQAKIKSIVLQNDIDVKTFAIADKNMISTVIRNLLSNAIKFTNTNGKISITSEQIKNKDNQDLLKITVKDSGIGIPSDILPKLFKIEENISTSGTKHEEGTGLGLILCYEFVKKHNGKIWVESEIGKGSKFIFTLPLKNKYLEKDD